MLTDGLVPAAMLVGRWLPYSETFVREQLRSHRRLAYHVLARGPATSSPEAAPLTVLSGPASALWYWLGQAPPFFRAVAAHRPAVLHAHFGTNGALAVPLARAASAPLAVSFHGHDVGGLLPGARRLPRYARYRRTVAALWDEAALLVCAAEDLATTLVERCGAPPERIWVHHLGVELGPPPGERPPQRFTVLMVGRLVEKKGMAHGLRAFARLARERPDARLVVVGEGPLRGAIEAEARRLALGERVRFAGALAPAEVRGAMAEADVILTPSVTTRAEDRESGVLVLKEAAAAGLPAIASRHGGIPEIVAHGETGLLAAERDEAALGEHLLLLAGDPRLRAELGARARAVAEARFDAARQSLRLEERLLSLAGAAPGAG